MGVRTGIEVRAASETVRQAASDGAGGPFVDAVAHVDALPCPADALTCSLAETSRGLHADEKVMHALHAIDCGLLQLGEFAQPLQFYGCTFRNFAQAEITAFGE